MLVDPPVLVLAACELEARSGRSCIWRTAYCPPPRYPAPDVHDSRLTAHNTGREAPGRRQIAPVWAEARGGGRPPLRRFETPVFGKWRPSSFVLARRPSGSAGGGRGGSSSQYGKETADCESVLSGASGTGGAAG